MMLTKELLKYRCSADKVFPKYLKSDIQLEKQLNDLVLAFTQSIGGTASQLDEKCQPLLGGAKGPLRGLKKILESQLKFVEQRPRTELREKAFASSSRFLNGDSKKNPANIEAYRESLAQELGMTFSELKERIYDDLPEARVIGSFNTMSVNELVDRYNLSQVQGLLLRARKISFTIAGSSVGQRRALFRSFRFHRLLGKIQKNSGGLLEVEMSGPLSIFSHSSAYGMRVANFFPHIVNQPEWAMKADIELSNKIFALSIGHNSGYRSPYAEKEDHIPEELMHFKSQFEKLQSGWKINFGQKLLTLGGQHFCFPDWELEKESKLRYVEVFHKWHKSQLAQRLVICSRHKPRDLILAISANLLKDAEVSLILNQKTQECIRYIVFKSLPSPKALLAELI